MIEAIIRSSLANRALILVAASALLAWGVYEAFRMPVDVFPDLTAPTVTVVAEAHGMAPEEVERLITLPIEASLNGAAGVRRVRSSTSVGAAIVWTDFEWGTDIFRARQTVAEKLQLAQSALPADLPPPTLAPITSIMGEILFVALTSDRHDGMTLKTMADWTIRRRLLAEPGVAQVLPIGGDTKQYQVRILPERLAAYDVSLSEAIEAARAANENAAGGFIDDGGQEYLIQGLGRVRSVEDIAAAVVAMRNGQPVALRDVADVRVGPALKRGEAAFKGEPAVVIGIQKQPGANTLELTARLDTLFADIAKGLPEGMRLETNIFRQADFIAVAIDNLMAALRDGAVLVIVIVFAALMSARATAIALLAIPLSLAVTIAMMKLFGASINTMTLGGMAIALGALVDDAIIVVENVTRRLKENCARPESERRPASRVVLDATREIQGSIVFATLIIMLVFTPLFFLSGVEGRLLAPLGFAYIVSLAASLVVAITVTPALSALLLPASRMVRQAHETAASRLLKSWYEPVLDATLRRWRTIAIASALALVLAIAGLFSAGRAFLPDFNEGSLTVSAVTLPGVSLAVSDELGRLTEKTILEEPEAIATARRTGRGEFDEHAQGVNASEIDVSFRLGERSKDEFLASLRARLSSIPGMNIVIGQPISHRIDHMLSGARANIAVKIFGPDLFELRRLAAAAKTAMAPTEGLVDLAIEQQSSVPILTVALKRDAIARHGLTVAEAAHAIEAVFSGQAVSKVIEADASFDLVVRYAPEAVADLASVKDILLVTKAGARLPLGAIAEIRRDVGPNFISRENGQREIMVMANVSGRDLLGVVEEIKERIAGAVALPSGYHVSYGGQFESAAAATRTLALLSVLVIAGIFLLLAMAFRASGDAALVMLNLPLALIGGVIGVFASGGVVSIASIIGFIALFGIATRNGVMMISHIRHLMEAGDETDIARAVKRGAMERLMPILMTALAAGLALIPLALNAGEPGSEIQAPMAIVILFGLLSSTALNMIVVPSLYLRFGDLARNPKPLMVNGL